MAVDSAAIGGGDTASAALPTVSAASDECVDAEMSATGEEQEEEEEEEEDADGGRLSVHVSFGNSFV